MGKEGRGEPGGSGMSPHLWSFPSPSILLKPLFHWQRDMEVPDAEASRRESQALPGQEEERIRDGQPWGHKPLGHFHVVRVVGT